MCFLPVVGVKSLLGCHVIVVNVVGGHRLIVALVVVLLAVPLCGSVCMLLIRLSTNSLLDRSFLQWPLHLRLLVYIPLLLAPFSPAKALGGVRIVFRHPSIGVGTSHTQQSTRIPKTKNERRRQSVGSRDWHLPSCQPRRVSVRSLEFKHRSLVLVLAAAARRRPWSCRVFPEKGVDHR